MPSRLPGDTYAPTPKRRTKKPAPPVKKLVRDVKASPLKQMAKATPKTKSAKPLPPGTAKQPLAKSLPPGLAKRASGTKSAKGIRKEARAIMRAGGLTKRQRTVIKRGSREIAGDNALKPKGQARFLRSAARDITGGQNKGYKQALVKSARTSGTKAEAKGVKKVLSRAKAPAKKPPRRKYGR